MHQPGNQHEGPVRKRVRLAMPGFPDGPKSDLPHARDKLEIDGVPAEDVEQLLWSLDETYKAFHEKPKHEAGGPDDKSPEYIRYHAATEVLGLLLPHPQGRRNWTMYLRERYETDMRNRPPQDEDRQRERLRLRLEP